MNRNTKNRTTYIVNSVANTFLFLGAFACQRKEPLSAKKVCHCILVSIQECTAVLPSALTT